MEENDITQKVGEALLENNILKNNMDSSVLLVNWKDVKSALVSGFIVAAMAMANYIIQTGDVFALNYHQLVNTGVIAALVMIVSLAKSWMTTSEGKFLGMVSIK